MNFGSTGSLAVLVGDGIAGPDVLPLHPRTPQAVRGVAGHGGRRPRVCPGDGKVTEAEHWMVAVTSHQLASADGSRDPWPRGRRMPVTPRGAVFRMSDLTASMLARVAPGRPLINNFLVECRSGSSSFDSLIKGHT